MNGRTRLAQWVILMLAFILCSPVRAGDNLNLLVITPYGTNVPLGQEIVFQFDRAVVPLGQMSRPARSLPIAITPALNCEWRWLDTQRLACRLPGRETFRPATSYTVSVGPSFKALDGTTLGQPVTDTFTTVTPRVRWAYFERWRSPVLPLYQLRFTLPVTAQAVSRSLVFEPVGGGRAVPARAVPFQQLRQGALLLPVPGVPGAMAEIESPQPSTPERATASPTAARWVWLLTPTRPLAPHTAYQVEVVGDLVTPLGSLPGATGPVWNTAFTTFGPFKFLGMGCGNRAGAWVMAPSSVMNANDACTPDQMWLVFNAPVPLATLSAVRVQPAIVSPRKLHTLWDNYPSWMLRGAGAKGGAGKYTYKLPFDLAGMGRYRAEVPAGVTDSFGRKLSAPARVAFATGHLAPTLALGAPSGVLEAGENTVLPVYFANLDRLDFSYRAVTAATLQGTAGGTLSPPVMTSLLAGFKGGPPLDRKLSVSLGVRADLDGRSGALMGSLDWGSSLGQVYSNWSLLNSPVFAEVTPWEVLAKVGHFDTLVWVVSLSTGQPVAGVTVHFATAPRNSLVGIGAGATRAVTDANGLAVLPGAAQLGSAWTKRYAAGQPDWYVVAVKGSDMALLPLHWGYQRSLGGVGDWALYSRPQPRYGHLRAWGVTAQGVYRPGATVHYAMFVRGMSADSLIPAPDLPYTFTVTDSTGKTLLTQKTKLSAFGGLHGELYLPETAATGWYRMTLAWPGGAYQQSRQVGRFLVAEFVPEAFQVRTLLEGGLFGPGDRVHWQVQATLHSGGPYTQAPVRLTTLVEAEPFAPDTPLAAGFTFDANPPNTRSQITIGESRAVLNGQGIVQGTRALPAGSPIVYGHLVVQGAVKSTRGTWVADRASAIWAARNRFVGLKIDDWLIQAGKPFEVHDLVVDTAGKPVSGSPVKIVLWREQLNVVATANGTGGFTPQQSTTWVEADHCAATSALVPGTCRLTARHAGSYRVVATVTDTRGREQQTTLNTWCIGAGEVVWQTGTHVQLVPDKARYKIGDVARVLVQNPYPGATALVTVERYGVLWKRMITLKGSAPVLEIPIERRFFPGAYLSVDIFSPRVAKPDAADLGRPTLAMGYMALPVVGEGASLAVGVTPARTDYQPRQRVTAQVLVKETNGKPAAHTRVVVAVVDEAVLDLLQDKSAYYDPRRAFYAPPQGPDMLDYSLVSQLITTVRTPRLGKGITPGGDGGGGVAIRSVFKYTAYWNAALETDDSGHASFSFQLPDNLTGWRLVAVALSPGAAMGVGHATVRVSLPIELGPALPNVVHAGDAFAAGFSVTDHTAQPQQVRLDIAAQGAAQGEAASRLDLAPYGHGLGWLDLRAAHPGVIQLLATAKAGSLGDALSRHIAVQAAGVPGAAASYGSLTQSFSRIPVSLPADAVPGSARLTIDLAPTALAHLAAAFESMRDDPLDTWEVHLSRAVMAADYLQLKDALPPSVHWNEAPGEIDATLSHAGNFQAPSGGMAFLVPNDLFVSPYLSAYTALAFDWLAAAGHPAPQSVRQALDGYLRQDILAQSAQQAMPGWLDLQVAAMDALAGEGQLPAGAAAGLVPDLPRLSLFGKALLLQLEVARHDPKGTQRVLTAILARAEQTSGSLSFQATESDGYSSLLASPLRANCVVLDALTSVVQAGGPEASTVAPMAARLLRWIDERRSAGGSWPNSQENVFCTTAEAHYAKVFEGPIRNLGGQVSLASRTIGTAQFASRGSVPRGLAVPLPVGSTAVVVRQSGQGRLYYGVHLGYTIPAARAREVDAGFSIRRDYQLEQGKDWVTVGPHTVLHRGDIVRVDLTVDVPAERHHVVLTDPLPGAFEAVNHRLATADMTAPQRMPGGTVLWFNYGAWPNYSVTDSGFYHRDIALDAVRFYAQVLPAGHYRLIYTAQVISPGRFLAPPPRVREIYQPDVFGRGRPAWIDVTLPGAAANPAGR